MRDLRERSLAETRANPTRRRDGNHVDLPGMRYDDVDGEGGGMSDQEQLWWNAINHAGDAEDNCDRMKRKLKECKAMTDPIKLQDIILLAAETKAKMEWVESFCRMQANEREDGDE
jgi:hypothetical protein